MNRALIFSVSLALGLALAACSPTVREVEVIKTIEVLIPVTVPCDVKVAEPAYHDTPEALAAAPDIFEAMKLRIAGRGQGRDEVRELRAALSVCTGVSIGGDNDPSTTPTTRGSVEAQPDPVTAP